MTGGREWSSGPCVRLFALVSLFVDPVVQALAVAVPVSLAFMQPFWSKNLPGDLNSVELHAHGEDGAVLGVVCLGARTQHGAEVVVLDGLLVLVDEVAPSLLAGLALHLVLVDCSGGIEVGELLLEVLVDLVVLLGEAQGRALDLLEDVPVCLHVLDNCATR